MTYIVRTLIDGLVFDHNPADAEALEAFDVAVAETVARNTDVTVQLLRGDTIICETTLQA